MNDKGAILPTVMVLMTLSVLLVIAASVLFKSHHHENIMIEDSYKLKTMLNMVENDLLDFDCERKDYDYFFNQGRVHVQYLPPTHYLLTGTLDNGFENKRYVLLPMVEETLIEEEKDESIEGAELPTQKKYESHLSSASQ